jgi:hypothetical protein
MSWSDDEPIAEDVQIAAAHPLETDRHDLYNEAMRLVGAKRSKGALVELVNWLLYERATVRDKAIEECAARARLLGSVRLEAELLTLRSVAEKKET